jgi:hypothetical protein
MTILIRIIGQQIGNVKKRLYGVYLELFGFQYDLYLHAGTVTRDHTYLQAQGTLQSYVLACKEQRACKHYIR